MTSSATTTSIEQLPPELVGLIFAYLDASSRKTCAVVCRYWRAVALEHEPLQVPVILLFDKDRQLMSVVERPWNQGRGLQLRVGKEHSEHINDMAMSVPLVIGMKKLCFVAYCFALQKKPIYIGTYAPYMWKLTMQ